MLNRLLKIIAGGLLLVLFALGVYVGISTVVPLKGTGELFPVLTKEKTSLGPDNILREEVRYLCGDTEISYQGMAPKAMWGKEISQIANDYPAEQGWIIDNTNKPLIILTKQVEDYCPEHKKYCHLGISKNKLAVYQGPLGYNRKLLRLEESLTLDQLNPGLKNALQQGENFLKQDSRTKDQLRKQLEFRNQQALNEALENIEAMD